MTSVSVKILMMYAGSSSAHLGEKLSKNLRRKLGPDFHFAQSTWNAELLRSPKLRKLAADDARDSDIVIIATPEAGELPEEMLSWLELWQDRRSQVPGAMVALLSHKEEKTPRDRAVRRLLEGAAARAHMEFFCEEASSGCGPNRAIRRRKPKAPVSPLVVTYVDVNSEKKYQFQVRFGGH